MGEPAGVTVSRPKLLDLFCGEGGAGMGYHRAGFAVTGVDTSKARLAHYPFEAHQADAIAYLLDHGHEYEAIHASPTCTGYSRGTAGIPDRLTRYDRLIAAVREALLIVGRPYVIENVEDAKSEMVSPLTLCGGEFNLRTTDTDGTVLRLKRHRLFEANVLLMGAGGCAGHARKDQVAGVYGGSRSDKDEARYERGGGYTPADREVQQRLLGIDWMTKIGMRLSIPPAYTEHIGRQLIDALEAAA